MEHWGTSKFILEKGTHSEGTLPVKGIYLKNLPFSRKIDWNWHHALVAMLGPSFIENRTKSRKSAPLQLTTYIRLSIMPQIKGRVISFRKSNWKIDNSNPIYARVAFLAPTINVKIKYILKALNQAVIEILEWERWEENIFSVELASNKFVAMFRPQILEIPKTTTNF